MAAGARTMASLRALTRTVLRLLFMPLMPNSWSLAMRASVVHPLRSGSVREALLGWGLREGLNEGCVGGACLQTTHKCPACCHHININQLSPAKAGLP